MRRLVFFIFMLIVAGPAQGFQHEAVCTGAKEAHKAGEFEKAIKIYTRCLDSGLVRGFSRAYRMFERGQSHVALGALRHAVFDMSAAIELDRAQPYMGLVGARLYRGLLLYILGEYVWAQRDFAAYLRKIGEGDKSNIWTPLFAPVLMQLSEMRLGKTDGFSIEHHLDVIDFDVTPNQAILMFLDKISPSEVVRIWTQKGEDKCDIQYFIGQHFLLKKKMKSATNYFQRVIKTCKPAEYWQHFGAKAELKRIKDSAARKKAAKTPAP